MLDIEMIGWLIHQQYLRLLCQRPGNMQALAFAAGEGMPAAMLDVLQGDFLQHRLHDIVVGP